MPKMCSRIVVRRTLGMRNVLETRLDFDAWRRSSEVLRRAWREAAIDERRLPAADRERHEPRVRDAASRPGTRPSTSTDRENSMIGVGGQR